MVRFHTVGFVLTWTAACGSGPSGPKPAPVEPPATHTPALIDAAVEPVPSQPQLACDDGARALAAVAPEPSWFCTRPDGTRHGPFVTLFPDRSIAISGSFRDGALDGAWQRNHPSGSPAETGTYVAGKKHGTWRQLTASGKQLGTYELVNGTGTERRWFEDGRLYSDVAVRDGLAHGIAKYFAQDGMLVRTAGFSEGKLDGANLVGTNRSFRFEEKYAAGVRVGKRRIVQSQVTLAEEMFDRQGKHDGDYKLWRDKNRPRVAGKFAHGKRVGPWVWHDRDGNKEREGTYVDGKRDGTWTEWTSGTVTFTGTYVAGKPDGDLVDFDRNGNELGRSTLRAGTGTLQTFHPNKKPSSKTRLVNGVEDGPYQELTPRGKVTIEGAYRAGEKHGLWKEWTPDGTLVAEQTWVRGKLDGTVKKYVDGVLSLEATYRDGQAHGVYTEHRNGKPAVTGSYAAGRKDGTWTHYAADGSVVLTASYKSGVADGPWRQLVDGTVLEGTMVAGRRSGSWTRTDRTGATRKLTYGP